MLFNCDSLKSHCEPFQAFQFNAKYLIAIHDHVYSCQFGTFIGKGTEIELKTN